MRRKTPETFPTLDLKQSRDSSQKKKKRKKKLPADRQGSIYFQSWASEIVNCQLMSSIFDQVDPYLHPLLDFTVATFSRGCFTNVYATPNSK